MLISWVCCIVSGLCDKPLVLFNLVYFIQHSIDPTEWFNLSIEHVN
jgi:hypothetical protein